MTCLLIPTILRNCAGALPWTARKGPPHRRCTRRFRAARKSPWKTPVDGKPFTARWASAKRMSVACGICSRLDIRFVTSSTRKSANGNMQRRLSLPIRPSTPRIGNPHSRPFWSKRRRFERLKYNRPPMLPNQPFVNGKRRAAPTVTNRNHCLAPSGIFAPVAVSGPTARSAEAGDKISVAVSVCYRRWLNALS